jgi:hypothetical protein
MIEAALFGSLAAQFRSQVNLLKWASIVLLAASALYPLRAAWLAWGEVPSYRERADLWDEREVMIFQLIEERQTDPIVPQFDGVLGVKELDVNANHWVNRCAAKYYGFDSIRAYPDK